MKRDGPNNGPRDPEGKGTRRNPGSNAGGRASARASGGWDSGAGRSGYGSESVRPHLRRQLWLKELLSTPFVPPAPDGDESGDD